jgi:hypothetical protein
MQSENEISQRVAGEVLDAAIEQRIFKVFLLSYAPFALKDDRVNIAVLMVGDDFADMRVAGDWQRVLRLDPEADLELLTALTSEIRSKLRTPDLREAVLLRMEDSWSNTIQLSAGKGCLTGDPSSEIEALAAQYL